MVLGLLWCNVGFAANEGAGPIKFPPKFEKRFKDYLGHVANKKQYKFAFAFHPEGANDWQAIKGGSNSLKVAEKKAIKACNKKAKKKGCKIFARGEKIVWNWDSIPTVYYTLIETAGAFDYINWEDVSVQIGEGPVSLSKDAEKKFQEYLTIYENNKNKDGFSIYFAISPDGKNSGDMEASSSSEKNIEMVKAMAIAECMSNNKKNKCYLYAINDEVVWGKKEQTQTDDNNDIVQQIKDLKELYDSGVLTKEEFEKAKKKLLN